MRKVASKHPFLWSILVILLFFASNIIASFLLVFAPHFFYENGEYLPMLVMESVMCLCGVALVSLFGYGHIWNQTEHFNRGLLCGIYMIVYPLFIAMLQLTLLFISPYDLGYGYPLHFEPLWRIIVFTVTMFLVGLTEESFFRGIVANLFWDKHGKDPSGVWTAVIYSGIIFAVMHSLNFINYISFSPFSVDMNGIGGVLVQITAIISMGMALAAIYYRCRNIWATIFLHAFLDFCGLLTTGLFGGSINDEISAYSPFTAIITTVPYLIVTFVILRPSKIREILTETAAEKVAVEKSAEIGVVPSEAQYPAAEISLKSSRGSKVSCVRAIVIASVLWVVLFTGCVVMSDGFREIISIIQEEFGDSSLDVTHAGEWDGERTFGARYTFEIDESGDHNVNIRSYPSDANAYVFVQLKQGDEVVFEDNYGGICTVSFSIELDTGEYELNLVYDYSGITYPNATYYTSVKIS